MPFEYTPPKYARVVAELQRRIASGEYQPGTLLPSEAQLTEEFDVARPTVVRALHVLRQDGWIESQQGKGRFVRGQPALEQADSAGRTGAEAINRDPRDTEQVLSVEREVPPNRLRVLLGLDENVSALHRRVLVHHEGEPLELLSTWVPVDYAAGTDLEAQEPLSESLRRHLETRRGVKFDHVVEQITARNPTPDEARTLTMPADAPVLVVYASFREHSGQPVAALCVVLPADRHELEDAYSLA
ncbi:GntR family transcriptional regulator [Allosalinactinospora lopnorensis]|uniref:GntR family transcriptional regulator n=1 Tax=Allosalinactinospora lopnorensis TaxID=1352348 RepID=UPI000623E526|nr:GntR family transcriptional regulator [Allosalinactinospora lopnorensis]